MATVSPTAKYKPVIYYKRDWVGTHPEPFGAGPWVRMIEGPNLGNKWLPGWGSGPLDIWHRMREIFGHYDVVYGFEYHPNVAWPVYLTKAARGYRFFSDWCDWYAGNSNQLRGYRWAQKIDKFFEERIRFKAEKVTVISRVLADRARSLPLPKNKVVYVPQGIDTEYCRSFPKEEVRRLYGIPDDTPVLATGLDGDMRRHVRIFHSVLKRIPNAFLVVVGSVQEPARVLGEQLGIAKSILWTGWVSDEDYPRYISCADICFLPLENNLNNRARFPGKVLDYLCAGRPVVTNDVGEVGLLFQSRQIGQLSGQESEEFAESAMGLLRDPDLCHYLGGNARRVMVKEWDWTTRGPLIGSIVEGDDTPSYA